MVRNRESMKLKEHNVVATSKVHIKGLNDFQSKFLKIQNKCSSPLLQRKDRK